MTPTQPQARWCPKCKAFNPGENQVCVKCGASMQQPRAQKNGCLILWCLLGVVMVVIALIGVFRSGRNDKGTSDGKASTVEPAPKPKLRWARPSQLVGTYESNEVAADEFFKYQMIAVKGRVGEISKDILGHPYVILTDSNISEFAARRVQASFSQDHLSELASLRRGQTMTVACTVQGLMIHVQLGDCRIPDKSEIGENFWK
jgi:predicted nucleic acid-binding Zn ribbon protein